MLNIPHGILRSRLYTTIDLKTTDAMCLKSKQAKLGVTERVQGREVRFSSENCYRSFTSVILLKYSIP